jgi:hypothetical protein
MLSFCPIYSLCRNFLGAELSFENKDARRMDRLETIDEDYYCGGAVFGGIAPGRRIGGGSDVDSDRFVNLYEIHFLPHLLSSDDAIQRQMRRIADGREQDVDDSMDDSDGDRQGPSSKGGRRQVETVSTKRPSVSTSKPKENKSDFEAEMDNLLTTDLLTFSAGWMPELQEKLRAKREHKAIQPGASPSTTQCVPEKSGRKKFASPKKRVRFEEAAGGSAETVLQSESTDAQVNDADVDESLGLHDTETNSDDGKTRVCVGFCVNFNLLAQNSAHPKVSLIKSSHQIPTTFFTIHKRMQPMRNGWKIDDGNPKGWRVFSKNYL